MPFRPISGGLDASRGCFFALGGLSERVFEAEMNTKMVMCRPQSVPKSIRSDTNESETVRSDEKVSESVRIRMKSVSESVRIRPPRVLRRLHFDQIG